LAGTFSGKQWGEREESERNKRFHKGLTLHSSAEDERIAFVILNAATSGDVIDNRAFRVLTADPDAGIHALVVRASSIVRTVGILHAFRSTFSIRIASVFGYTTADTITASGIGSTR